MKKQTASEQSRDRLEDITFRSRQVSGRIALLLDSRGASHEVGTVVILLRWIVARASLFWLVIAHVTLFLKVVIDLVPGGAYTGIHKSFEFQSEVLAKVRCPLFVDNEGVLGVDDVLVNHEYILAHHVAYVNTLWLGYVDMGCI